MAFKAAFLDNLQHRRLFDDYSWFKNVIVDRHGSSCLQQEASTAAALGIRTLWISTNEDVQTATNMDFSWLAVEVSNCLMGECCCAEVEALSCMPGATTADISLQLSGTGLHCKQYLHTITH